MFALAFTPRENVSSIVLVGTGDVVQGELKISAGNVGDCTVGTTRKSSNQIEACALIYPLDLI
jgi:hypothetical protein